MTILLECFVLMFVTALVAARYFSVHSDLKKLDTGLQSLLKGQACPTRLRFGSNTAELLWQRIAGALAARRSKLSEQAPLSDVLSVGREIVSNLHREQLAAESACELLLRQTAPETSAAAVLLRNSAGRLQIAAACGAPLARIEAALTSFVECALDSRARTGLAAGGHESHIPPPNTPLDFSALGVHASYFAAITHDGVFAGCIWLGFRSPIGGLSKEKTLFIQALAQHCAASFSVAKKVQEKIAEQEQERRWLLGMSHDLRAPGNSALYSLRDLLSEEAGPLTAEQRIRLEIIEDCLRHQIEIVSDILDLTKHRQGLLRPVFRTFALKEVLSGILETYQLETKKKSLELRCAPIPDLCCRADSRHIRRVLVNLLSNALKYTDSGCIEISFAVTDEAISVAVSDTGIGVAEAERGKLFQEFSRLQNAESRQGVGLGLTIARTLSEINGGSLLYQPNRDCGSTFAFSIPRSKEISLEAKRSEPRFRSILLVEDDDATRRMHYRYLGELAHSVCAVSKCDEAIEFVKQHKPEVIVSDLYLENDTTSEPLLSFVRREQHNSVVVLTTGSGNQQALELLKQRHGLLVLEKPIDRRTLQQTILSESLGRT